MRLSPIDIRIALENWVSTYQPHSDGDVLVGEMCFLGKARRADLVHANGKLSAYEIKSEADTLSRWPGQEEAYLKVFDHVWLCCHTKHIEKAIIKSNSLTGILLIDDFSNIAIVRQPKKNRDYDIDEVVRLLWRSEIDYLLLQNDISVNAKERIAQARARLLQSCPKEYLKKSIINILKQRYNCRNVEVLTQYHLPH
jgi:hypothetical protein